LRLTNKAGKQLLDLLNPWLKVGVGILPEVDELVVVVNRLLPAAARLVSAS
jgi:hypothetical protein